MAEVKAPLWTGSHGHGCIHSHLSTPPPPPPPLPPAPPLPHLKQKKALEREEVQRHSVREAGLPRGTSVAYNGLV
ncbi:hypothetical protein EYF80_060075 [Liparis tanakae]|uniref:Uncharacterized protein n=1 Tax=Liparis tanakae TaxID=230148 RepID=A0A4Z2ELK6_9TELE|nr:hypothetical protein EYF80_060075 [Liparis tanakae]